jgi:hypothetical protein
VLRFGRTGIAIASGQAFAGFAGLGWLARTRGAQVKTVFN